MLVRLKTANEIEEFAVIGKIAADIMEMLINAAKPNITTIELDSIAKKACIDFKVVPIFLGYRDFPACICTSINEELVHGIPSNRILCKGDLLKIDLGVEFNGFIGDIAKTIRVGMLPDKLISDCQSALMRGIAIAKPNCDIGDIGEEISKTAKENGWQVILDYGGHGIDRNKLHADPFVANARIDHKLRLRSGMVLAIEPMFVAGKDSKTEVAKDGWTVSANGLTAHFEHTIAVNEVGEPRILTRSADE